MANNRANPRDVKRFDGGFEHLDSLKTIILILPSAIENCGIYRLYIRPSWIKLVTGFSAAEHFAGLVEIGYYTPFENTPELGVFVAGPAYPEDDDTREDFPHRLFAAFSWTPHPLSWGGV